MLINNLEKSEANGETLLGWSFFFFLLRKFVRKYVVLKADDVVWWTIDRYRKLISFGKISFPYNSGMDGPIWVHFFLYLPDKHVAANSTQIRTFILKQMVKSYQRVRTLAFIVLTIRIGQVASGTKLVSFIVTLVVLKENNEPKIAVRFWNLKPKKTSTVALHDSPSSYYSERHSWQTLRDCQPEDLGIGLCTFEKNKD